MVQFENTGAPSPLPLSGEWWLQYLPDLNQSAGLRSLSDFNNQDLRESVSRRLPFSSDPAMSVRNLYRYLSANPPPLSPAGWDALLDLLGASQFFAEIVIDDPQLFCTVFDQRGAPVRPELLRRELFDRLAAAPDLATAGKILRLFRKQQLLRIGFSDLIENQRFEVVVDQISHLADTVIDSAVEFCRNQLETRLGIPINPEGKRCGFVVLALGKLGGCELNYSSDVDLIFLFECEGMIAPKKAKPNEFQARTGTITHREFFDRLGTDIVKILADHTSHGVAYRVDLRLRPEGQRGPIARSLESATSYYDLYGRTWERQALIKARPIAGDIGIGQQFLFRLEPWIYRRYLNFGEINGIKALKRKIERRSVDTGTALIEVKTGWGGIRDVEFCTQFLQLLNGGDLPQVRCGGTLMGLERLESIGCLTTQEHAILSETYRFLRRVEHRLQTMDDLQTHKLPTDPNEFRKFALRLGYRDTPDQTAEANFRREYQLNTRLNRTILNHLLHDAFGEDAIRSEPEVDLILDPNPDPETIKSTLERHRFRDIPAAHRNLILLSRESARFLSTPRCRHFLASIAPRLLAALARTPDPDQALVNLTRVSESIGGKGVLWELFSFHPPSLTLFVELCAGSQLLTDLLVSHPGMVDELLDSLVRNQRLSLSELKEEVRTLCKGAEDPKPSLIGFMITQILQVGVRQLLKLDSMQETLHLLTDIAESILVEIARIEMAAAISRRGNPRLDSGAPCRFAILGLGRLGGREMNYHSDLDIVFIYEGDGATDGEQSTTNIHFFAELAQRMIRLSGETGPHGRLYEIDPRLRPTGKSGSLAISLDEFHRYFESGGGQLWERLALTRARIVHEGNDFGRDVMEVVHRVTYRSIFTKEDAREIVAMRHRQEQAADPNDLKRSAGGLTDLEFLVQALQLKNGFSHTVVRQSNLFDAIQALEKSNLIDRATSEKFQQYYLFLAQVNLELRLMHDTGRVRLSTDDRDFEQLAWRMGRSDGASIRSECLETMSASRKLFLEVLLPG